MREEYTMDFFKDSGRSRAKTTHVWMWLCLFAFIVAIGGVIVSFHYYGKYQSLIQNPSIEAALETRALVSSVSKVIDLPVGEEPTVATVRDTSKLQGQPFFEHAQNGDVLLMYAKADKAILYRPAEHKIIEVSPLSLGQDKGVVQQPPAQSDVSAATSSIVVATTTAELKVAYYDGSSVSGLGDRAAKIVVEVYPRYKTVFVGTTVKKDYTGTMVADLSGSHRAEAESIAAILKGKVGTLPQGEARPNADIAVIVGK